MREKANKRFLEKRRTAQTEAYTQSYDQASQLMKQKDLFDTTGEPEKVRERYGRHDFGRHCLMARRLLEGGATFVKVTHSNYDTHHEKDRKSTRLNSSHLGISYAVFCLKKKKNTRK